MTTFLIITCIIAVAAMWCWTPFSLFGVDGRLTKVEASYRRHMEEMDSGTSTWHRCNKPPRE